MSPALPKRRASLAVLTLVFVAFGCSPRPAAAQVLTGAATEEIRVAPGVLYRHLATRTPAGEPWSIHVLEIDRSEKSVVVRSVVGHGSRDEIGRQLPSEMGAQAAKAGTDVLAVVNGDYDLGPPHLGIPLGLAVSSRRLWTTGLPAPWPALGLLDSGEPVIAVPEVSLELSSKQARWIVASLNKPPGFTAGEPLRLFTREYGASVKDGKPFRAVVIGRLEPALPLRVDSAVRGIVVGIQERANEVAIPGDALVLIGPEPASLTAAGPSAAENPKDSTPSIAGLRPGEKVTLRIRVSLNGREAPRDVGGGGPVLIENGQPRAQGTDERMRARHPRTAGCYNDHKLIFVVVDGRQPQLSVGMTHKEVADLMVSLGCTAGMGFDGGGSSVMAVALPDAPRPPDAAAVAEPQASRLKIVNSPSDGQERGRGNAWLILRQH
jgi:hypothetical protein